MFNLSRLFNWDNSKTKSFRTSVSKIIGRRPKNIELYFLAFRHNSSTIQNTQGFKENNERLEYLGDAVLGMVIAEYLFKKFPYKDEGFLTEVRSRIVNRDSLNVLAKKIGINNFLSYEGNRSMVFRSMNGDALEALVGAVYLDLGFNVCKKFILTNLIASHFDINHLAVNNTNYKSKLIEWAQRENKTIRFDLINEAGSANHRTFTSQIVIDNEPFVSGVGITKKKAEQEASLIALDLIEKSEK